MKYLSVLVLLLLLNVSWAVVNRPFDIPTETHIQIQAELAQIIENVVKESSPSITDLEIDRIESETLNYNRVKATFQFSYKEPLESETIRQSRRGVAFLSRQERGPGTGPQDTVWSLDSVQVLNTRIDFESGSEIKKEAPAQ